MDLHVLALVRLAELAQQEGPEPEDVKAGWVAFGIFGLLILAVVVLGLSLVKRLKNVDAAEQGGLYDPSRKKPRHQIPNDPGNERP
ncbi:hypothetical protein [Nocardioides nanhaiensis]|uniref:Uncharacterized protein n=1 Tax=Nocardioides nanhaiensis TaxID=1476871 RepID=A0ABP8VZT9_9ACTN